MSPDDFFHRGIKVSVSHLLIPANILLTTCQKHPLFFLVFTCFAHFENMAQAFVIPGNFRERQGNLTRATNPCVGGSNPSGRASNDKGLPILAALFLWPLLTLLLTNVFSASMAQPFWRSLLTALLTLKI